MIFPSPLSSLFFHWRGDFWKTLKPLKKVSGRTVFKPLFFPFLLFVWRIKKERVKKSPTVNEGLWFPLKTSKKRSGPTDFRDFPFFSPLLFSFFNFRAHGHLSPAQLLQEDRLVARAIHFLAKDESRLRRSTPIPSPSLLGPARESQERHPMERALRIRKENPPLSEMATDFQSHPRFKTEDSTTKTNNQTARQEN